VTSLADLACRLLGPDVVAEDAPVPHPNPRVRDDESLAVERAGALRRNEFLAGRTCTRVALERLGIRDFAVLVGPHREPTWPRGIVGAITHVANRVLVVVAPRSRVCALGIDLDYDEPLAQTLWRHVCTERERETLTRLPCGRGARAAKVLFSAKESLYKCQFSLSRAWVGFTGMEISFAHDPLAAEGAFRATLRGGAGNVLRPGWNADGRFVRFDGYVLTTIAA
jgi:4'-phosphopantetheinyl transferase EntD